MAIIDMDRISVIGLGSDEEQILDGLMELGAVHITDVEYEMPEHVKDSIISRNSEHADISGIEENMEKIAEVLKRLEKFDRRKKGLFERKRTIAKDAFEKIINDHGRLLAVVDSILDLERKIASLHMERNKYANLVISLSPWEKLNIPLEKASLGSVHTEMGCIPLSVHMEELEKRLLEEVGVCHLSVINRDRDHNYVYLIYHKAVTAEVEGILKSCRFAGIIFENLEGTAAGNIHAARERIREIDEECALLSAYIESGAQAIEELEILYDALGTQKDLKIIAISLAATKNTFILRGWVPAHLSGSVTEWLRGKWICEVAVQKPAEEEEFPVLLKNNNIGSSVEAVTSMYSPPHPRESDPNTVTGVFFILFFGLMLGDGGYGLLILLAAAFMLKKGMLEEGMKRYARLMLYCGISTIFWGAMFGGWFGLPAFAQKPLFLNPFEEPETFLGFALLMGVLHIYVGIGMNAVKLIQEKKYLDILLDVVVWYVFYTGFIFLVLPYVFSGSNNTVDRLVNCGGYMVGISSIILILTQGRKDKGVIRKITTGLGSLYGVIKFLSDVLSYSRLMALGLATSVIGLIVYDIASMNGLDNPIGIISFILIMTVGHALNFGIAVLGAYVHSSRLQYIEFFSKFYKGGGVLFKPFKAQTKFINVQGVMHSVEYDR